jgi:hypothetical protein
MTRDPDEGLHKLITKHDRLAADNNIRAAALRWELLLRPAHTPQGHSAKIRMLARADLATEDKIAVAWALGAESGRLGLGATMPRFLAQI